MHHLIDANVYLAATVGAHAHHAPAREFIDHLEPPATLVFCRVTEMACLRLLTQQIAPGFEPLSNSDSIAVYFSWRQDDRVWLADEPVTLVQLWPRLASRESASSKLWTDAYLAAFAIAGHYRLVTFDSGFRQFLDAQLDLQLLESTGAS